MPLLNMKILSQKNALSLVEITVAALIFTIAAVGAFATFSTMRKSSDASEEELTAANYGRQLLEDMRADVSQATWDSGALSLGPHTLSPQTINGVMYNAGYAVANSISSTGVRKVTLNVIWNRP